MGTEEQMHDETTATMESETSDANTEPVTLEPEPKLGRGSVIATSCVALVLGILIFMGIRTRVHAEAALVTTTRQDAGPTHTPSHAKGESNT